MSSPPDPPLETPVLPTFPKALRQVEIRKSLHLPVIGWREWLALPELGVTAIKAKVDTGARSSALHAFNLQRISRNGQTWVRFQVHPRDDRRPQSKITAQALLVDERWVKSSNGGKTLRPVIRTMASLGGIVWPIELTLVRRDLMGFRMLLGRSAVRRRFLIHPGVSFRGGIPAPEFFGEG
jgi:hypothetical protein